MTSNEAGSISDTASCISTGSMQRPLKAVSAWTSVNFGLNTCYFRVGFFGRGSASASMSTQVYRAEGNSSTSDHLQLATTDASAHHGPTYSRQEGRASPRGS